MRFQTRVRSKHQALTRAFLLALTLCVVSTGLGADAQQKNERPRARDLGIRVGILPTGQLNAITDVADVRVGHTTLIQGDQIRTGVTAILPHGGNLFREKVAGAVFVGNGFGKLAGSTQVNELGEIETPVLLTSTLSVPRVADALLDYMLALPGNETVASINPLVAETNDGYLNDIRARRVTRDDVIAAIKNARGGAVEEGSVGAGTGTVAFGFKGGIGTSSRKLPVALGGYTVGVLVQTNFGGVLTINGAPVGRELGRYYLKDELERAADKSKSAAETFDGERLNSPDGSIIMVVATDAPVDARNLRRMAARALMGLARTGAAASNGSGDYAIAFSTAPEARIRPSANSQTRETRVLSNDAMSPLFLAAIEATEEAIYNSLFRAQTLTGRGHTVEALPVERTLEILRKYHAVSETMSQANAQDEKPAALIEAPRAPKNLSVNDRDNAVWKKARAVRVTQYWSGELAPASRQMEASVVWNDEALFVRFVYPQKEPMVVSATPQLDKKTLGLWDRDVCEVFIAPNPNEVERYFEFEGAPTGEWVDLGIHWKPDGRVTDWDYHSGMTVSAHAAKDLHTIIIRIPWSALGRTPKARERWRINFFRCVGKDPQRGYLAWQPTRTPEPAFHVPQVFGWIEFKGR